MGYCNIRLAQQLEKRGITAKRKELTEGIQTETMKMQIFLTGNLCKQTIPIVSRENVAPYKHLPNLQSWTKVLGTVLQCSYFSVISRFHLKTLHPFRKFLAVLPPSALYKVETRKKTLNTSVQHCLWGEGRGWTCVKWKTPRNAKLS